MAVFSKKVKELVATEVIEYTMYENHYSCGSCEMTYSIAKRNYQQGRVIEWVVRGVRKDTAEMVWRDRVDEETWVYNRRRG